MRKPDRPFVAGPVLESRQRVRYLVVGIQVGYQGGAVGHSNGDQNVPGRQSVASHGTREGCPNIVQKKRKRKNR